MIDRTSNSSEGVQGLDINESLTLSHENDNSPCIQDDMSHAQYKNKPKYNNNSTVSIGDYYGNN